MNFKLWLAARWMPRSILFRELDRVASLTTRALDSLLIAYAPDELATIRQSDMPLVGSIDARRRAMAMAHNARVAALVKALGHERAVSVGREIMFATGRELGEEAKLRLGVGDSRGDLLNAAKVLYKVLGIEFRIRWNGDSAIMEVNRCSLAEHYTPEACLILSGADEGVVHGLNPAMSMVFEERITDGAQRCIARLRMDVERKG